MKTSKPKTQGRDPQEMRVLLERKAREGLTYPQLSQLTGIPRGTLAWWAHRLKKEGLPEERRSEPSPFVEVRLSGGEPASEAPPFELVLSQGRLRIPPGFHGPSLQVLLRILRQGEGC